MTQTKLTLFTSFKDNLAVFKNDVIKTAILIKGLKKRFILKM